MDTTTTDPVVGQLLDDRYEVQSRIARGGMATVYTALDTRLHRVVAVKLMAAHLAEDEDFVARFIHEARAAAALSHPNVVSVFDQGEDGQRVFLVMEYVRGRTLRDVLDERGRLSPAEAVALLEPVLAALAAAHGAGLIHRDVKPENVLIADDGRVKVADFGLARAIAAANHTATTGMVLGTPAYLSPEQVKAAAADARSDVYAAGILLVEMLTGAPPYAGETFYAVADQHVNANVPAPSRSVDGVPPELDELALRATQRDPDARPADAGAFLTELRRVRREVVLERSDLSRTVAIAREPTHHPTLIEPLPPVPPLPGDRVFADRPPPRDRDSAQTRPRRRRGLIALLVVLLLGLLAGVGGWWYGSGRYTKAPALARLSQTQATEKAQSDGFDVRFASTGKYSETVAKDLVLAQRPGPGARIARGGTIVLTLSNGPERFVIPGDIVGKSTHDAKTMLTAVHLRAAGDVSSQYNAAPAGTVLGSDPHTGTPQKRGTLVTLIVSKGPPPVDVPDVHGKSLDDATNALAVKHLKVAVSPRFSDTVPKGSVISQDPPSGTLHQGDTVTLAVSKGPDVVTVPGVSGIPQQQATAVLADAGLKAQVLALPGGPGTVLEQRPAQGKVVKRGSQVTLYVF